MSYVSDYSIFDLSSLKKLHVYQLCTTQTWPRLWGHPGFLSLHTLHPALHISPWENSTLLPGSRRLHHGPDAGWWTALKELLTGRGRWLVLAGCAVSLNVSLCWWVRPNSCWWPYQGAGENMGVGLKIIFQSGVIKQDLAVILLRQEADFVEINLFVARRCIINRTEYFWHHLKT